MYKRKRQDRERPPRVRNTNHQRPPHLKGKEIGLYYAQRSKENKVAQLKKPLGAILLAPSKREQIQRIIESSSFKSIFTNESGSYDHVEDSLFKRDFLRVINETIDDKLKNAKTMIKQDSQLDEEYYKQHLDKMEHSRYKEMQKKRKKLPSYKMRNEILDLINENQVVVISGQTGCGKTTQVAQFILDHFIENKSASKCKIMCTQPRRISAIAVAQRVAEERNETLGETSGYHIRLEKILPRDRASICFCTTGIVLKTMETDPSLSEISHLILDEIHERDVMSDFVLALIKKIILKRKDLKVILMSATLNSERFSQYYNNAPHLTIPGFTFPVEEFFLEDVLQRTGFTFTANRVKKHSQRAKEYCKMIGPHVRLLESEKKYNRKVCMELMNPNCEEMNIELIFALIANICEKEKDQGAILVFLTGFAEISTLMKMLKGSSLFPQHKYLIFPLHSQMPTVEQKQIFDEPPPGKRKIIIATNIAETSITIEDVVYVIDCGKIKMNDFDAEANNETLSAQWVAIANSDQRRGRAGRVKPGQCFHLFSKARHMELLQYQVPEILRSRLENVILTAKVLQLGKIELFFNELIDSPEPESVSLALNLLKRLNALTDDEKLTPLGYDLAKLPISPQLGKMILFGAIFSCVDPILSIAATLDFKEPFQLPLGLEKEVTRVKLELANGIKSDHLLFHETLKHFEVSGRARNFCSRHFLSYYTLKQLEDMKKQLMMYLHEMKFVPNGDFQSRDCNKNSCNLSLIKAIICAGLYPNIAISHVLGKKPTFTPAQKRVDIHPKSILAACDYFDTNILVYYRKMKSTKDFIHDASLIHPLPVVFFGDKFNKIYQDGRSMITINDSLKFVCSESTTSIIKELRDRFNWFLEHKISHPGPVQWDQDDAKILEVIIELITCEDLEVYDDDTFDDRD